MAHRPTTSLRPTPQTSSRSISEQICVDNPSISCTHQLYQLSTWQSAYPQNVKLIFWSSSDHLRHLTTFPDFVGIPEPRYLSFPTSASTVSAATCAWRRTPVVVGPRWRGWIGWKIWKPVKAGEIDLNWWPIKIENSRKLWGKRRWTNEAHKVQNARLTGFPMSMFSWETSRNVPTLTQSGKHSAGQHSAGQHSAARSGRRSRSHSCQKSAAVWSLTCHLEHGSSNVF